MSTTAIRRADIAVFSADGKLQLIVEVKNRRNASREWAMNARRNLYVHSMLPTAPYFLLALPDHFYLWRQTDSINPSVAPDYEVPAQPMLAAYIDEERTPLEQMNEYSLELIVASWLMSFVSADVTFETVEVHERWLLESGLYEAIKNGEVRAEADV